MASKSATESSANKLSLKLPFPVAAPWQAPELHPALVRIGTISVAKWGEVLSEDRWMPLNSVPVMINHRSVQTIFIPSVLTLVKVDVFTEGANSTGWDANQP